MGDNAFMRMAAEEEAARLRREVAELRQQLAAQQPQPRPRHADDEFEAILALRKKFKEQGLHLAVERMTGRERDYARRRITRALEFHANMGRLDQ